MPGGGGDVAAEQFEEDARSAEYRELRRKFWIAALLSLPALVIAMSHRRIAIFDQPWINGVQLALTTSVVFAVPLRRHARNS